MLADLADPILSGDISGAGSLFLSGAAALSSLTLSGTNNHTGGTTVNLTTLRVASNVNLGANAGPVTLQNGTLNPTASFTSQHQIVLNGGGNISVSAGLNFTQSVGISGTGTLTKLGSGTMTLTAPATHAGNTIINDGMLKFGSGALPDAFDVTVNSPGIWDLNGVSDAINGLFGGGTVLLSGGTFDRRLCERRGNFSGSIQGTGAVVKTGLGTQILSGANSYTMSTSINAWRPRNHQQRQSRQHFGGVCFQQRHPPHQQHVFDGPNHDDQFLGHLRRGERDHAHVHQPDWRQWRTGQRSAAARLS